MPSSAREHYQRVRQLTRQGRYPRATREAQKLLQTLPGHVPTLQLLAMAAERAGYPAKAESAFQELLRIAPGRAQLELDYGRFLRRLGRAAQAETHLLKAARLAPEAAGAWHSLALMYLAQGRAAQARASGEKMKRAAADNPAAWELCAAACQRQGDLETAIAYCKAGLEQLPEAERLHYSLAQLLREAGEFEGSAEAYARAQAAGFDGPELYRNWSEALLESGNPNAALQQAQVGIERFPDHAILHRSTARLHCELDAPGDPVAPLLQAAQSSPQNPALWQTLIELLKRLRRHGEASTALREARRLGVPRSPALLALAAADAAENGDKDTALRRFDEAVARFPEDPYVLLNFAMQLLKSADPAKAEAMCRRVLTLAPFDQLALAYRGTAWQLLGDSREGWLLDYERMIVSVDLPLPAGYSDREAFFADLRDVLEALHRTRAAPIEQSVRGGTQTNGFLFRLKHPLLATLEKQIRVALVAVLKRFPDDSTHPFWSRRHKHPLGDGLRFSGAWSVRLRDQGFHANHIHPQGWISSALYIALPKAITTATDNAGHIQFGSPLTELGLDLPPRRTVKPTLGTLLLFPSYMWHGTLPFHSHEPRITVAFDVLPSELVNPAATRCAKSVAR